MYEADTTPSEPSLLASIVRLFEAGQRVILDRLDLAYYDLTQLATRTLHGATLIAIGAVLMTGAWFTLMGGVVVWLQQYVSLAASLTAVGAVSALLGAAAIAVGVRRAQSSARAAAGDLIASIRDGSHASNGAPPPS